MNDNLPTDWAKILASETSRAYFHELTSFVDSERRSGTVYPQPADVYNALHLSPFASTRVVILGQDPYHGAGQAHGLAFSVQPGVKPPPSLVNIFKELASDIGCATPTSGSLTGWAQQGVLLLNTVLTVRAGEANSHKGKGWELFTDSVIKAVASKPEPVVFVLWGGPAQKKAPLIDTSVHTIVKSVHPSPLSAYGGFFGSRPFSAVNAALVAAGEKPIDWCQTT
ncbi:MAG TPA: uracil-DNA glycosylase [Capsulimonadaceae bacterium]|jgi:uracil-DNA glycosylase